MDDKTGILIVVAVVAVLVGALLLLVIPEPAQRAVIANERLDVAVLAFDNSSSWPNVQETLRGRIESKLVNDPQIQIFSRAQLDALLMERALATTGLIDTNTAVEIGSITGVSKLLTGTVYAVDTQSRDTTVCVRWENGECVEEAPAKTYSVSMLAQVEVIDARTGKIEKAFDLSGSQSTTIPEGTLFGGFDTLLASASSEIAERVSASFTTSYTREVRYGLYESVQSKRAGYIGKNETHRFPSSSTAHLIVHFTRVQAGDLFDVEWIDSTGQTVHRIEDVVSPGEWRLYTLDLSGLTPGRFHVRGTLNGGTAFDEAFTVVP